MSAVSWKDTDLPTLVKRVAALEKKLTNCTVIVYQHPEDYKEEWLRGAVELNIIQHDSYVHGNSYYVPMWGVYFLPDRAVKASKNFPEKLAEPLVDWLLA